MRAFLIGNAIGAAITLGTMIYAPLNVLYAGGSLIVGFMAAGLTWARWRNARNIKQERWS
jgi:hypothetical protein